MPYSIWTIPPQPVFSQLESIILDLSQKYNSPAFEPHLTLLGNIDQDLSVINEKLHSIESSVAPLNLRLGSVSFSTTYFQSVLVRVNATAPLMELNLKLKEMFDVENSLFMPHMSLLYGDHSMEIREKIAQEIAIDQSSFQVTNLVVTPAVPDPKDWDHLTTIELRGR